MRTPPPGMWVHPEDVYIILCARKKAFMAYLHIYLPAHDIRGLIAEKILSTTYDPEKGCKATTYAVMICYRTLMSYAKRHKNRWLHHEQYCPLEEAPELTTPSEEDIHTQGWMQDLLAVMPTARHRAMVLHLQASRGESAAEAEIRVRWGVSHHDFRKLKSEVKDITSRFLEEEGLRTAPKREVYHDIYSFFDAE
jgi:hypothetical protein